MFAVLLTALFLGYTAADKEFVVDGVLRVATEQLVNKSHDLSSASESFNQLLGRVDVLFQLVLSRSRMVVEEMSRLGGVDYSERTSEGRFRFHGVLRSRVDCDYALYGSSNSLSSGTAIVLWDIGFNASLLTDSCNLVLQGPPIFDTSSFHIDLYSEDMRMNVSYSDNPFNSITSIYQQTLSVLLERSLGEIPICNAIPC